MKEQESPGQSVFAELILICNAAFLVTSHGSSAGQSHNSSVPRSPRMRSLLRYNQSVERFPIPKWVTCNFKTKVCEACQKGFDRCFYCER